MTEQTVETPLAAPRLSRRRLFGTAAVGAAVAAGVNGLGASPARAAATTAAVPTTVQRERAVVVGSGFGGGVTALRLAQVGVSTLVLERGIRWPTGPNATTFCRFSNIDNRSSWLTDHATIGGVVKTWDPYVGVIESIAGNGMTVNCGAAYGGGSLMYHGMTLQPTRQNFARSMPAAAGLYDELNFWAYPLVARMLGISTIPDDIMNTDPYKSSRLFRSIVPQAGLDPVAVPLPVDWNFVRGELDGRYAPTYTTSDIAFGVNNGGKHSLDVTYLAAAEATGRVRVSTLHVVRDIALDSDKHWVLSVDRIDTGGVLQERKTIIADAVFLNAGSAGTTRLLVKSKAKGLIPNLPDSIGTQWGNNGDRIFAWIGMNGDAGTIQGGPACVGGRDTQATIPYTVLHAGSPAPTGGNKVLTVVGLGIVDNPAGTWAYDAAKDDAVLTWPASSDAALQQLIAAKMQQIAQVGGGFMLDTNAQAPSTWHALGGVPMGSAVDLAGRVLGQRGLYVLDGARIPGSTGACNPSMTIAALAEHSMSKIILQDVGRVF
ncbi:cholesterol oxidase [Parafrankia irregularis]|uniref:Cholesterol oxidase n=1 Tax=Parafrankia irregularis TaxID=795642 RepID=A0A0S4QHJ0_9ACTN|nr:MULTISPECIES: GMC oxidoreductase [Parafrankia]MBE3200995.1 GMC family oxidoreductase [Parafrankia sp. CH37]CUU54607.1 cholesterol oxidase [Parafrankia irregularis]